jgi:hypothetical protein
LQILVLFYCSFFLGHRLSQNVLCCDTWNLDMLWFFFFFVIVFLWM